MARIALIKLFPSLNLATTQLSGELKRAGHASKMIFMKDYETRDLSDIGDEYRVTEHPGIMTLLTGNGESKKIWNCYKPFSETEYQLLFDCLKDFNPDAIGFSVHSGIINESGEVSERLKQEFSLPILWGGPGPSLEPDRCMKYADLICIGEGEEVILEVADRLDKNQGLEGILGTWHKTADGIQQNDKRALAPLDDIAIPNWCVEDSVHINNNKLEENFYPTDPNTEYSIMTQRGCPFSCSFCIESKYQDMFGKKNSLRRRSPEIVIEELKWAKANLPIKTIWFWDDVFTINPRWLDKFLPMYKKEIGLPFWGYTYPTTHTPELLKKLRDAGCTTMTMGVQSGSQRVLSEHFNRPTKTDRVVEAAQEILDAGIKGSFDLITKNQVETEEDLRETLEFLLRFPQEMQTFGYMEMMSFPSYDYTNEVSDMIASDDVPNQTLTDDDYAYYHKLFHLTRTDLPREQIRALADDPEVRKNHNVLNPLLAKDNIVKEMIEWRNLAPLTKEAFN